MSRRYRYDLTPYDDFPAHQAPYPFSTVPASDINWDEGYWFAAYSPDNSAFFACGLRMNPNTDMIGVWAAFIYKGTQHTFRASRVWRPHYLLEVGPYRIDFVEPMKRIRLSLAENESGLSYDIEWTGVAPAYLEDHHMAVRRHRRTSDQSRYVQSGLAKGTVTLKGEKIDISHEGWAANRDHSWGIYEERRPLSNLKEWLPPPEETSPRRVVRIWSFFQTPAFSGFFNFHEDENGTIQSFNDVFGAALEGIVEFGWDCPALEITDATHRFRFRPGSRVIETGEITLTDVNQGVWRLDLEVAAPPLVFWPIGYFPGAWRDGGNMHTYHGNDGKPVIEYDELDISVQPFDITPPGKPTVKNQQGHEYCAHVTITDPKANKTTGIMHIEFWVDGRYIPYGFEDPNAYALHN